MQGAGSSVRRGWFSWDLKDELSLSRGRRVPDRGRRRVRGGPEGKQFRGALNWGQGDLKWGCRGHCGRESLRNWIKKAVIVLRGRWGPEGGTSLSLALGQQREALCQPRPPCGPTHLGLGSAQRWTGRCGTHAQRRQSWCLGSPHLSCKLSRAASAVWNLPGPAAHNGPPVPRSPGAVGPGLGGGHLGSGCPAWAPSLLLPPSLPPPPGF